MKQTLLTILRDEKTDIAHFRDASEKCALILAGELADHLEKISVEVKTQLAQATGEKLKNDVVFIPILRSGLAILPPFLKYFPYAKVGFVGMKRDEETAIPKQYYNNLPEIKPTDDVIVLDPMIATGGSGSAALKILIDGGIKEEKIIFVAIISAQAGIDEIKSQFPKIKIICVGQDKELNNKMFIVPGLGDFGDRYFGTPQPVVK
jgi:uracil phosphoribosyltransferase